MSLPSVNYYAKDSSPIAEQRASSKMIERKMVKFRADVPTQLASTLISQTNVSRPYTPAGAFGMPNATHIPPGILGGHNPYQRSDAISDYANRFQKKSAVILKGSTIKPKPRPLQTPLSSMTPLTDTDTVPASPRTKIPKDLRDMDDQEEPSPISELIRSAISPPVIDSTPDHFFNDISGWKEEEGDELVMSLLRSRASISYNYLEHDAPVQKAPEDTSRLIRKPVRKKSTKKQTDSTSQNVRMDVGSEESSQDTFGIVDESDIPIDSNVGDLAEASPDLVSPAIEQSSMPPLRTYSPQPLSDIKDASSSYKSSGMTAEAPWLFSKDNEKPDYSISSPTPTPLRLKPSTVMFSLNEDQIDPHSSKTSLRHFDVSSPMTSTPTSDSVAVIRKKLISSAASAKTFWRSSQSQSGTGSGENICMAVVTGKKYMKNAKEDDSRKLSATSRPSTAAKPFLLPAFTTHDHNDVVVRSTKSTPSTLPQLVQGNPSGRSSSSSNMSQLGPFPTHQFRQSSALAKELMPIVRAFGNPSSARYSTSSRPTLLSGKNMSDVSEPVFSLDALERQELHCFDNSPTLHVSPLVPQALPRSSQPSRMGRPRTSAASPLKSQTSKSRPKTSIAVIR